MFLSGGCGDIRSVGPRDPPIAPRPQTLPQVGNWGTKVLSLSPPASVRGCAAREHGSCRGISQGLLGLGVGEVLTDYDHYYF